MKKTLRKLIAFALVMLCAMNVDAGKQVLLSRDFEDGQAIGGWGGATFSVEEGAWKITNPEAKQSWEVQAAYDFSEVFLPNSEYTLTMKIRGSEAGQISIGLQNADNNYASVGEFGTVDFGVDWMDVRLKCMCNGEGGKRFLFSFGQFVGDIYIDDLKLSVEVEGEQPGESGADPNLRWQNVLYNGDFEDGDSSSIVVKVAPSQDILLAPIVEGAGVDGSRGTVISVPAQAEGLDYESQLWIKLPQAYPEGTDIRVRFDVKANNEGSFATQAHRMPGDYIFYQMIGNPSFTPDWQKFEYVGKVSADQAGSGTFQSIAFNLSQADTDVDYCFDNFTFELLNNELVPQYSGQVILMDLGRKTNISELVGVTGKRRLTYPVECATVKVDGEEAMLTSVEAFSDGRFYIFVEDLLDEDMEVEVSFTNPINPAYRLVYRDGDFEDVLDYNGKAYFNENVEVEDAIPGEFATPEVLAIDPENGAFNLPVSFNEFKVVFDKPINCKDLTAWFAGEKLAVTPAEGYAEEVTLTRKSIADLAEGAYQLELSEIHAENAEDDATFWGTAEFTVNIGHNLADFEEAVDLINMLETAKAKRDANVDAIYEGEVYDALCAIIAKYEAEYTTYTSPTVFKSATKTINAAVVDMDAHHNLVDTYYSTVDNAIAVVAGYSESKFASMSLFVDLKNDLAKYLDAEGNAIKLIADADLQAAVDALKATTDNAAQLFTTGASKNDGTGTTGIAALTDRLRLGAESLIKLGVSAEDELVVAALNALEDDDKLAEQLKYRLKLELYNALNSGKDLFAQTLDETTLEMVSETYDMTVFFKNPNIYCNNAVVQETGFNPETTPGWEVPEGAGNPNITTGWNAPSHVYTDCTFQNWGYAIGVEQTVVDLPAGVYTVKAGFGERDNAESGVGSYLYAKNSSVEEGAVGDTIGAPVIGQSFPNLNVEIKNVVVADGQLTVGVVGSATSHIFFNNISVQISNTAAGFDYKAAYDETKADYDAFLTGITGTEAAPAQVLGIELYDLNGRRIAKAQQGIVIMKKYMSNGTIQVEKVMKK